MGGEEFLAEIRNPEEQVELRTDAHRPEHGIRSERDAVHRTPGEHENTQGSDQGRDLIVNDGRCRMKEMPPARTRVLTGMASWSGDVTHQKAHLQPAPRQDGTGESRVGAPDRGVGGARVQHVHGHRQQQGGHRHAEAEGTRGQAIQEQDDPGGEPPHQHRVHRRNAEV